MNDLPHRDIYSGMVAEELNKEGYFGQEQHLYGFFCLKDGHIALETAPDEESCAAKSLDKLLHGCVVSDYTMIKQRVYDTDEYLLPNLMQELELKLIEQHLLEHLQTATVSTQSAIQDTEQNLRHFFSSLSPTELQEKHLLLAMLLGQLAGRGQISQEVFRQLHNILPQENFSFSNMNNCLYGFAYREQGSWQFYANAYFPAAWQKWLQCSIKGFPATGLLYKAYPSITSGLQRKNIFLADVKTILNENFLQSLLPVLPVN